MPGRLRERQVVRGRAVRATDFGVFVELLPGVDGLLHVSEIPRHQQGAMREAVAANAEIAVMVVGIDPGKRRVALTLAPDDAVIGEEMVSTVAVGAVLTGTVDRIEQFGVFVRLGPGQTGLVPNAELGASRGADPRKAFPAGSEMKVLVLAIEEGGRRIRLSREKALVHEEQAETQAYLKGAKKAGFGDDAGRSDQPEPVAEDLIASRHDQTTTTTRYLTDEQIASYQREGYLALPRFLDADARRGAPARDRRVRRALARDRADRSGVRSRSAAHGGGAGGPADQEPRRPRSALSAGSRRTRPSSTWSAS